MWMIGMLVCAGLMLAGHALVNSGHGSHSHERAAVREPVATATAPDRALAEAAREDAPEQQPVHHH